MNEILVTGGTGVLGRRVVDRLRGGGLAVLLPLLLLAATYGMSRGDGSVGERKAGERRTEA